MSKDSHLRIDASREREYRVEIVEGPALARPDAIAAEIGDRRALIVSTPTVVEIYGDALVASLRDHGLDVHLCVVRGGEAGKSLLGVKTICRRALEIDFGREDILVGLGGGVCTDLVAVAASWIRRGVAFLRVPTTLIGQVDAGIGVKGALNFAGRKNYLGTFHPPRSVVIDPAFLRTLPPRHLRSGLAEILKIAIVRDADLFGLVETHVNELLESGFQAPAQVAREVLWRSIKAMLEELAPNLYEDRSYERPVDLGHTFSPTLEAAADFRMTHGEAVAVDMALSAEIAREMEMLEPHVLERILSVLEQVGLPLWSPHLDLSTSLRALTEAARARGGSCNLVMPTGLGSTTYVRCCDQLPGRLISAALEALIVRSRSTATGTSVLSRCVVYDIGGTSVRAGLYDPDTRSVSRVYKAPSPNHTHKPGATTADLRRDLVALMGRMAQQVVEGAVPDVVSVGFPGPVNGQGRILAAPTLWGRAPGEPVDLGGDLRRLWPGARVLVLNDVTAAGYRYVDDVDEPLCVTTVSSGIGNKVFIHGVPFVGPNLLGGEFGHVRVDFSADAPTCECGGTGHLSAVASGRGVLSAAQRFAAQKPEAFRRSDLWRACVGQAERLSNEALVEAFQRGDVWTAAIVRQTARPLAQMLCSVHHTLGIERFVIIGGFALSLGEEYRRCLADEAARCGWKNGQDWNRMIELGKPDDLSGLIGAGRFASGERASGRVGS